MDIVARKAAIRRRITHMRYPRRGAATFTDANDHNPQVLKNCPDCRGRGANGRSYSAIGVEAGELCSACGGSGVTDEVEPYFATDAATAEVPVDVAGWMTCPGCQWRFKPTDARAWTGRRHLRCGQAIKLV